MKALLLVMIRLWQNTFSRVFPPTCRFVPSCSDYAIEAFRKYGFFKGLWLAGNRLIKCHPWNPGGHDPVP